MLDGSPKQQNHYCRCTTKTALIVQPEPMIELVPDHKNVEAVTEPGRKRVTKYLHLKKRQLGRTVNCDGVSNVTDYNLEHPLQTESPIVETEEGTVKDVRLLHSSNA
jgi:hypothetical protein